MKEKSIFKKIIESFSGFELKNRSYLSRHKFLYALIAGAGVVLYWRGVWHLGDSLQENSNVFLRIIFSPLGSIVLGVIILASIGILVQQFIGSDVIISGIKKEKEDIDKTEDEILEESEKEKKEASLIKEIDEHLHDIEKRIDKIDHEVKTEMNK